MTPKRAAKTANRIANYFSNIRKIGLFDESSIEGAELEYAVHELAHVVSYLVTELEASKARYERAIRRYECDVHSLFVMIKNRVKR